MPYAPTSRWLRRFTKLVAASTVFLVYAGAMVTSTGSGLAVPDWPLSYGMLFPPMVGGIFYEHGHRMVAGTVGILTLIQAIWLQRSEPKRFLRKLGWISLLAVIVQAALGGMTVIFLLPKLISISHAALAEIFLCLNASIAFFASATFSEMRRGVGESGSRGDESSSVAVSGALAEDASPRPPDSTTPRLRYDHRVMTRVVVAAVFVQMFLGAVMRHFGAGLAIPDFPLSFGKIIPPVESFAVAVNFSHRIGALVVLGLVIAAGVKLARESNRVLRRLYGFLVLTVSVQIALGAVTVWSGKHAILTSLHVMNGAFTLALAVVLALAASSVPASEERRGAMLTTGEVTA